MAHPPIKSSLTKTKRLFKPIFQILAHAPETTVDLSESAIPAYAHKNPLIDLIFWGRLSLVEKLVLERRPSRALDFGCGSGVMSYCLASSVHKIIATDVEPAFFKLIENKITMPENVTFTRPETLGEFPDGHFDVIIALDVLEHIDNLTRTLAQLHQLLSDDGVLIISGPTENLFYKIGRMIAGKRFHGGYHKRNILNIESTLIPFFTITQKKHIPRVFPLFTLLHMRKQP